ncbi:MAG TPA: c-type cytochrome [Xanthobacteraceae bacterium]
MRVCWSSALGLALAALVWSASAPVGLPGALAQSAAPAGDFQWKALGERTYDANCSGCHQRSGSGIAGGFPPLAGHAPEVFAQKGRAYMVRVILFGLTGAIEVAGTKYNGNMPSWDQLKDEEIAAVIDHVLTAWDNDQHLPKDFRPVVPSEIAAARADKLTGAQVYALREPGAAPAASKGAPPSFTPAQAERGELAYLHSCVDCHGTRLDNGEFGGPPLKGLSFARHWEGANVAALFGFMRAKMPPDRPGQLTDETYADIIAFILGENGYKPGDKELPPDANIQEAMSLKK